MSQFAVPINTASTHEHYSTASRVHYLYAKVKTDGQNLHSYLVRNIKATSATLYKTLHNIKALEKETEKQDDSTRKNLGTKNRYAIRQQIVINEKHY